MGRYAQDPGQLSRPRRRSSLLGTAQKGAAGVGRPQTDAARNAGAGRGDKAPRGKPTPRARAPELIYPTASKPAWAQAISCSAVPPLTPIAPTTASPLRIGSPPPKVTMRGIWGTPATSAGASLYRIEKFLRRHAQQCGISFILGCLNTDRGGARHTAKRFQSLSSRTATTWPLPSSSALATAAATIFCAMLDVILCLVNVSAIRSPFVLMKLTLLLFSPSDPDLFAGQRDLVPAVSAL